MGKLEASILSRAQTKGGVISRAEMLALGMSATTLKRRLAEGWLVPVARGLYVLPGVLLSERSTLVAATTALGAVASHESAARLHGLDGLDPRRITVSVPVRRTNRFRGVIVHQLTDLRKEDVTAIDGIPTTTITRTIIDLAAVLPEEKLAEILDQAVRRGMTTYGAVAEDLESLARRGKRGVVKLRRVLAPRLGGTFVSESTLESRLLQVLRDGGLPLPDTQFRPPWLRHMNGRVDLAYPTAQVIVEGDSLKWHGTPEAFQADRQRDNLAQLAGWIILRFTWEDITKRPAYVVATVRRALKARSL
ncbi:MAG: AbiEi antitoxin N-terminal domain-containing protein [Acidimicrobiia bacterium]